VTPGGAGLLLANALLLAGLQMVPYLPSALSIAPLLLATAIVQIPGAAAAVAGAYLLPRSLVSLLNPAAELPPLLLIPAFAIDLVVWLRPSDLGVRIPRRRPKWQIRDRRPRRLEPWRLALGAVVGAVVIELLAR
jgi:hypothetical protein